MEGISESSGLGGTLDSLGFKVSSGENDQTIRELKDTHLNRRSS